MGYDHAEQKEIDPCDSGPSEGSSSSYDGLDPEKQGWNQAYRRGTVVGDAAEDGNGVELRKTHTHTLGVLKMRGSDDDLPTDWWFASTAVPLVAATFAPMANLLSIAALVVFWRNNETTDVALQRFATSTGYPDPGWCYDLNVASLICGFVGNLFLLFNFTKRVRYIVALPATIILFILASGILIGITVAMEIYVPPGKGQVYSQGYWNAVIAACLYAFNAGILMINMVGYFLGHYPQHFTLTDEQRNLILQTMMFFIWLGGGAAVFARTQGWSYPDALYFCDVTVLTIGFGDIVADNDVGRGLIFPFSVGGTVILGLMVSSIHKFAGELSKDKVLRKHVESRRINTLSRAVTAEEDDEKRAHLERQFVDHHRPSISSPVPDPKIQADLDEAAARNRQIQFSDATKVDTARDEDLPTPGQFMTSPTRTGWMRNTMRIIAAPVMVPTKVLIRMGTKTQKALIMREEKDRFDQMRKIQHDAGQFKKWYALGISTTMFALLWCVGAVVFWQVEHETQGLSYFEALYFCYVSLLTIGYGDLSPKSNAGKPFFVVWSLIAVPSMTILVSDMGDTVIASFKRGTFKLADFTVLPKAGLWHDVMNRHQWLLRWWTRKVEKHRKKKGLAVGPVADQGLDLFTPTIDDLANEDLSEGQLTKKLAFAIRRCADDLCHSPGKKYAYEDWAEFTRLIRFTKMDVSTLQQDEDQEGIVEWGWLDEDSPMLSEQTESEWVLDRLCESLLRLLKKNKLGNVDSSSVSLAATNDTSPRAEDNAEATATKATGVQQPTVAQERRQRALGADAVLTFFTGDRRDGQEYASGEAVWSKKAREKKKEARRRSSGGERRGPFAKLIHKGPKGAVGGGRGGAGMRTLKARDLLGSAVR